MNNGEIDKKIEFIIEQQAQFSADIQVMREVHEADAKLLKEETKLIKEETKFLKEQYRHLSDAVMTVVGLVGRLAQAQERTDTKLTELAEAQARTEERLNIFINVVERHLGGNGTKGSPEPS